MVLRSCWFPAIYIDPYGIVIFEDKGHMCKVIAAMLISTNRVLIPGTNHYYLWSLAPASTMVRLRLKRAATESSYPTKWDMYIDV